MAVNKTFRTSKLDTKHTSTLNLVNSTPQALHTLASPMGVSDDEAEKRLSLLVDEGLAVATKGDRTSIKYFAVRVLGATQPRRSGLVTVHQRSRR